MNSLLPGHRASPEVGVPRQGIPCRTHCSDAARCSMDDVVRWSGCSAAVALAMPQGPLAMRHLRPTTTLVHEHQRLDQLYMVSSGCLKLFTIDSSGFEQVTGFAMRGSVIGLDAIGTGCYTTSAVALEDASVCLLVRWSTPREQSMEGAFWPLLQFAAARELQLRTETQCQMAPASAEIRVVRFLLHFGQRQAATGYSDRRLRLPMNRRDIASYLGLAHETVSRAFTLLSREGLLEVGLRDVELIDPVSLRHLAHSTRGVPRSSAGLHEEARSAAGAVPLAA